MNNPADFLSGIARAGLGVAPLTAHGIKATGPCKVAGRHISEAPNAESFAAIEASANADARAILQHAIKRESSGTGLGDWTRITCSCGFIGPKRHGYESYQYTNLSDDERAHKAGA